MSFVAGKIFWYLTQPGNLLLLILIAGWLLLLAGARRLGHLLLGLGLLSLLAVAVLPVGSWLMVPLEDRFRPGRRWRAMSTAPSCWAAAWIPWISAARDSPALTEYADRMTSSHHPRAAPPRGAHPGDRGRGGGAAEGVSEGPYMRRLLVDLAASPATAFRSRTPRATRPRRARGPPHRQSGPGRTPLSLTSALHMPRAVGCFRRLGWDVVPSGRLQDDGQDRARLRLQPAGRAGTGPPRPERVDGTRRLPAGRPHRYVAPRAGRAMTAGAAAGRVMAGRVTGGRGDRPGSRTTDAPADGRRQRQAEQADGGPAPHAAQRRGGRQQPLRQEKEQGQHGDERRSGRRRACVVLRVPAGRRAGLGLRGRETA